MAQFILSPVLAILITNYSVPGTFIIIGGLMLNIVASSAMYRPTEIQSEIDEQVRPKKIDKALLSESYEHKDSYQVFRKRKNQPWRDQMTTLLDLLIFQFSKIWATSYFSSRREFSSLGKELVNRKT